MAKMRMGDISKFLHEVLGDVEEQVQLAIHKEVADKVGHISAITIQAQMRAKGIHRAKATGTHLKRSRKEQAAANKYGSMLDTYYKVWSQPDMNRDIVFAGNTLAAYKARFRNDGWKNHHYWEQKGPNSGSGNDYEGKHFIEDARKILSMEIPKFVQRSASQALSRHRTYKKNIKVG